MSAWYDSLETRPAEAREGALMARLPGLVEHAIAKAPGWAELLSGVEARAVSSRKALARLPVLRKGDLRALQQRRPPFGDRAEFGQRQLREVERQRARLTVEVAAGDDEATTGRELALRIVREHLPLLAARDYAKLKKLTGCDEPSLRAA